MTILARESSGLEHDLVTSRRTPGSAAPPFRRKRRRAAAAHAATYQDLEVGGRHPAALLRPDGAEREDRLERRVGVRTSLSRATVRPDVPPACRSPRA